MSAVLTKREVARRANRTVEWVSGVIDARGYPVTPVGKAQCVTEEAARHIISIAKARPRKRDSVAA